MIKLLLINIKKKTKNDIILESLGDALRCLSTFEPDNCSSGCSPICANFQGDPSEEACPLQSPTHCTPGCVWPQDHALIQRGLCVDSYDPQCGGITWGQFKSVSV